MKHILLIIALIFPIQAYAIPAMLAVEARSGEILVRQNEKETNYPASLTKIMTLYITFSALEQGMLEWGDKLYVSSYASRQPKSKLYLKKGDVLTVDEAVKAMIIRSANDAAVVIAEAIGGSEEKFLEIMNTTAKNLGLENTTFNTASGLSEKGYTSSATDLIRLSLAIMQHFPQYYDMFKLKEFTFKGKKMRTTNTILRTYKGAEGLKTGYTNIAGYNLVSVANNKNGKVFAILMDRRSVRDRDNAMRRLLDLAFKRLAKQKEKIQELPDLEIPKAELENNYSTNRNISISQIKANEPLEERRKLDITNDNGGGWGIQVGAYYNEKQALDAAKKIAEKYFSQENKFNLQAPKSKNKRGKFIYTAVIGNLSKNNAYEACVHYKKCFIMKPSKVTEDNKSNP